MINTVFIYELSEIIEKYENYSKGNSSFRR